MKEITLPENLKRIMWPFCVDHGAMMDINYDAQMFSCAHCGRKVSCGAMYDYNGKIPGVRTGSSEEWEASQPKYAIQKEDSCIGIDGHISAGLKITNPDIKQTDETVDLNVEIREYV